MPPPDRLQIPEIPGDSIPVETKSSAASRNAGFPAGHRRGHLGAKSRLESPAAPVCIQSIQTVWRKVRTRAPESNGSLPSALPQTSSPSVPPDVGKADRDPEINRLSAREILPAHPGRRQTPRKRSASRTGRSRPRERPSEDRWDECAPPSTGPAAAGSDGWNPPVPVPAPPVWPARRRRAAAPAPDHPKAPAGKNPFPPPPPEVFPAVRCRAEPPVRVARNRLP